MPATYTLSQHDQLDDIMDEIGHGRFQIIALVGLGCRIFVRGSVFSLTAMLEPYFKCDYNLSYFAASFYLMIFLLFCAISSPLCGWLANIYGKRKTLLLFTWMNVVTAILHVMSSSFPMVVLTLAGFGIFHNAQYLVYPFLLELLCKSGRKHISIVELFYVTGNGSGVIVGYLCLKYLSWQWAVISCILLPLIPVIVTLGHLPESPRYLLANGDEIGAVKSLVQISLTNNPEADKSELIRKYTKALCDPPSDSDDDDYDGEDDEDDDDDDNVDDDVDEGSVASDHAHEISPNRTITQKEQCLQVGANVTISNKDLWLRVIAVCIIHFVLSVSRTFVVYESGQRYTMDSSQQQCYDCLAVVSIYHLISVTVGSSVAIFISYNFIGYIKRRLAMRSLITVLAIAILPFYFRLHDWLLSCFFFLASVLNECLLILMLVYSSEVVPSSVRGFANNLMFGFLLAGALLASFMVTFLLHISHFLTFLCLHIFVLICLVVVYLCVIETKDVSLN